METRGEKAVHQAPLTDHHRDMIVPLVNILNHNCKGRNNAWKAREIISEMALCGYKLGGNDLRELIWFIRQEGLIVGLCSTPHEGYFVANTPEEMDSTIKSLQSRLFKQRQTYLMLKRHQRLMMYTRARAR
jgi:hypothetical protein